jgi:hypothetical protein
MKKTVCVDLDAVLARYKGWEGSDHIGDPNPGAVDFMRTLGTFAHVVVYTTRVKADLSDRPAGTTPADLVPRVKAWLDGHGIHYDEIYVGQGKPIAVAYVDDRAVQCEPQVDDSAFASALARCLSLSGEHAIKEIAK